MGCVMARRLINLVIKSPPRFVIEEVETKEIFVSPRVQEAQLRVQQAINKLRAEQIKDFIATPIGFEFRPSKRNPSKLVRVPIKRPTPTPRELARRFPVAQPAGVASRGAASIFKGTLTTEDGRVIQLFEPPRAEAFIIQRRPGESQFEAPRTLFGGLPVVPENLAELQAAKRAAPPLLPPPPQTIVRETFPEPPQFPVEFQPAPRVTAPRVQAPRVGFVPFPLPFVPRP